MDKTTYKALCRQIRTTGKADTIGLPWRVISHFSGLRTPASQWIVRTAANNNYHGVDTWRDLVLIIRQQQRQIGTMGTKILVYRYACPDSCDSALMRFGNSGHWHAGSWRAMELRKYWPD